MLDFKQKQIDENKQGKALVLNQKGNKRNLYIESYGCQMNFSDSEIVASILSEHEFDTTANIELADLVLINTCSIREKAEQTIRNRLTTFIPFKRKKPNLIIGILGCMAERLKNKFLEEEKLVDLVVGPDAYRDLPNLLREVDDGRKAVNVMLSKEETYADISPVRLNKNGVSAFVSIMRGCDNMCSFCVVPFTRGRERSRDPKSILKEIKNLVKNGYKEVTLLGQNVDSFLWTGGGLKKDSQKLSSLDKKNSMNFSELLDNVASNFPNMRIRFSTSHPKDMNDEVLYVMAQHKNICKHIHLPVQSGSSRILKLMNRGYTRDWYKKRVNSIRKIIPNCGISMDIITGFCTETEEDHQETLSLMKYVKYDFGYMFKYSERPKTLAQRKLSDNVNEKTKARRLTEIINLQKKHSSYKNKQHVGKIHEVLIEGISKKSKEHLFGRNTQNTVVVFPKGNHKKGDYVNIIVTECTAATLIGIAV